MRILIDYRPALRGRTGVGEYVHELARALARHPAGDALTLFTSSWKDRPAPDLARELPDVRVADRRIPVRLLNLLWHRLEWPPVELLARGPHDVVHSLHPLLMPARDAAQVVTIHDLDFLAHPERTRAEIRRDYPGLVRSHAHRAGSVVVPSRYTGAQVEQRLGVPADRIAICPPGAPEWAQPARPSSSAREEPNGKYILFVGTLEPRKNVAGLLEAYRLLVGRVPGAPKLLLAGRAAREAGDWLAAIRRAPLAGKVEHLGYVNPGSRRNVYEGAALLVMPSFDEGFGLPVLEAMAMGVPVVASNRGALPEVLGDCGCLIEPEDIEGLAAAIDRMIADEGQAAAAAAKGVLRARQFTWDRTASLVRKAYERALAARGR